MTNNARNDVVWVLAKGTIDSQYYEVTPPVVKSLPQSLIPGYLAEERKSPVRYCFYNLDNARDDSKQYSDSELYEILHMVKDIYQNDGGRKFVISFGTDAMIKFGRMAKEFCNEHQMEDSSLILTGSMEPLINHFMHKQTDAPLNLDFIDNEIRQNSLKKGVWMVMAGTYFDPGITAKDIDAKLFRQTTDDNLRKIIEERHEKSFQDKNYSLYSFEKESDIKKGR